jgi:hypothetical protein
MQGLARRVAAGTSAEHFDLEGPVAVARLGEPMTALASLRGLVVIDEVQRLPALVPVLRVRADRPRVPAWCLLLGSASPELVRHGSETLAGRIAFVDMTSDPAPSRRRAPDGRETCLSDPARSGRAPCPTCCAACVAVASASGPQSVYPRASQ